MCFIFPAVMINAYCSTFHVYTQYVAKYVCAGLTILAVISTISIVTLEREKLSVQEIEEKIRRTIHRYRRSSYV